MPTWLLVCVTQRIVMSAPGRVHGRLGFSTDRDCRLAYFEHEGWHTINSVALCFPPSSRYAIQEGCSWEGQGACFYRTPQGRPTRAGAVHRWGPAVRTQIPGGPPYTDCLSICEGRGPWRRRSGRQGRAFKELKAMCTEGTPGSARTARPHLCTAQALRGRPVEVL